MTAAIWNLELQLAVRRRRVAIISMVVPLVLVAAVSLGGAPPPHAALVFTVLFTFFGTFGAAVPWARDNERGWLERLELAGAGRASLVVQRWLSGALIDLVELLPSWLMIVVVYRSSVAEAGSLLAAIAVTLLAANILGILVASLARSIAETALLASVSAMALLHAGGVFRSPVAGTFADAIQRFIPFHYLLTAIQDAVGYR
jgi:ABC-type polysaccharide/polyol phosphate export permease